MEHHSVETIVAALNAARVRYLIAGGLAVVAHGYVRFTADVDLIVDLEPAKRQQWTRENALTVFSVVQPCACADRSRSLRRGTARF